MSWEAGARLRDATKRVAPAADAMYGISGYGKRRGDMSREAGPRLRDATRRVAPAADAMYGISGYGNGGSSR